MHDMEQKEKELLIKLNTEGLTPAQIRILKSIHSLIASVVVSEDETEYFESSANLMKKAAELIKNSHFALEHKNISYGTQALEFAVDCLNDQDDQNGNLDN